MTKQYYLSLLLRDELDFIAYQVDENECNRLRNVLSTRGNSSSMSDFFLFDTALGRTVVMNLDQVQAVRYLWQAENVSSKPNEESLAINIRLSGRAIPLKEYTEDPEPLYTLFSLLEYGSDEEAFPSFIDEDGELIQLNAKEIVWIDAPTHIIKEGRDIIDKQDGE